MTRSFASRRWRGATSFSACGPLAGSAKSGAEAEAYAKSVVMADFEEAGDADVLRKVQGDLEAAGHPLSETDLRRTMDELMVRAVEEIQAGR